MYLGLYRQDVSNPIVPKNLRKRMVGAIVPSSKASTMLPTGPSKVWIRFLYFGNKWGTEKFELELN